MYLDAGSALSSGVSPTSTVPMQAQLTELISPLGGVITGLQQLGAGVSHSGDTVTLARLGEVGALHGGQLGERFGAELDGIGADPDPAVAAHIAAMEGLERYATAVADERRWITASAQELGTAAIDLRDVARCSDAELAAVDCPLTRWDPTSPLRWVLGWSLLTGAEVWVPAVMAYLTKPVHLTEQFWLASSSGCAAADTPEQALLGACRELIERDAVAIAWLQRFPLPRLAPDQLGSEVTEALAADFDRERIMLFDATSDLEVPVVQAVLLPGDGLPLPAAVSAGCAATLHGAALKALRELSIIRAVLWGNPGDRRLTPRCAFAHLLDEHRPAAPSRRHSPAARELTSTVEILAREAGDVVAVELTPVELASTGIRVMRVIAPPLIPFLGHPQVRYLGSRRLYETPPRIGYPARRPGEVNPWPSPLT
jgi:ribosomal protein S12 methylthiotransferase accessory factor